MTAGSIRGTTVFRFNRWGFGFAVQRKASGPLIERSQWFYEPGVAIRIGSFSVGAQIDREWIEVAEGLAVLAAPLAVGIGLGYLLWGRS